MMSYLRRAAKSDLKAIRQTRTTQKTRRFSLQFAVLIESGFPRENRILFCIKTPSFANVNYCYARIINRKSVLSTTANSVILQKL